MFQGLLEIVIGQQKNIQGVSFNKNEVFNIKCCNKETILML